MTLHLRLICLAAIVSVFSSFAIAALTPTPGTRAPLDGGAASANDTKCGGGYDSKKVATCGFGAMRARVKHQGKDCAKEINKILCKESMWAGLGLQERVQRVTKIAMKDAPGHGVDFRAMPCVIRRESIWFDPAIISYMTCKPEKTTDQGLGQAIFTTFSDLVEHFHFQSKVPPFDKPPYTKNPQMLFEAMALSAELQLEVAAEILRIKLKVAKGDYEKAFMFYNGGVDKITYGQQVGACYQCVTQKLPSTMSPDQQVSTNIDECLDKALSGNGVDYSFSKFSHSCRDGADDDKWKWPYWVARGVDPSTKGLSPATHLPWPPGSPEALAASAQKPAPDVKVKSSASAKGAN